MTLTTEERRDVLEHATRVASHLADRSGMAPEDAAKAVANAALAAAAILSGASDGSPPAAATLDLVA